MKPDPDKDTADALFESGLKKCTKCNEVKPLEAFDCDVQKRYGRTSQCKKCHRKKKELKYFVYHERLKELDKLFQDGASRCTRCKLIKPLDEFLKSSNTKYKIFRCCKSCNVEYRRRRTPSKRDYTRWEVFEDDDFMCYLCEEPVDMNARWPDPDSPTIDHVIPLCVDEGQDARWNVRLACLKCNLDKRAFSVEEYLSIRDVRAPA